MAEWAAEEVRVQFVVVRGDVVAGSNDGRDAGNVLGLAIAITFLVVVGFRIRPDSKIRARLFLDAVKNAKTNDVLID